MSDLVVRGARTHNLRGVDLQIRRGSLSVLTGPSGSGKSSLAFDTLYAEAQRRFVESLQTDARQFLEQLPRPDVDRIEGLSPAVAVRQESPPRNPRSTVATLTDVHDFLRIMYARVGRPHCPRCGLEVFATTRAQMVEAALALPEGTRLTVQAPRFVGHVGPLDEEFARLRRDGYARVMLDGAVLDLSDAPPAFAGTPRALDVQIDRLVVRPGLRARLVDSIDLAARVGEGLVRLVPSDGPSSLLSEHPVCPHDLTRLPAIEPRTFSWNSPHGACAECHGSGEVERFDESLVVPDASRSIEGGALAPWGAPKTRAMLERVRALAKAGIDVKTPFGALDPAIRARVLHGEGSASPSKRGAGAPPGVLPALEASWAALTGRDAEDDDVAGLLEELGRFRARGACPRCGGARLSEVALGVKVGGLSIRALEALSVHDAQAFLAGLAFEGRDAEIAAPLRVEIAGRLAFLNDVGVGYLTLDRASSTLSTGEAQRIRLATRIGHGLVGVLYVLDEPSIGLHPRDTARLIETLVRLRDAGNTVVVVEHDLDIVRAADEVFDLGPGAGVEGGRIVAHGTPRALMDDARSLTGAYLSGKRRVKRARPERPASQGFIEIEGATLHNLTGVDVRIPRGALTAVTGVSGAGKSALVVGTLLEAARQALGVARGPAVTARVRGLDAFERVVSVDDRAIGRSSRSNPATYCGLLDPLRELFASLPEARARGWDRARFSFNQKGGRCEACRGEGVVRIDLQFLPDLVVSCEACGGRRYDRETLEVRWRGLSIADVLDCSVEQARALFEAVPALRDKLDALSGVGLGYLRLGQRATTLSGGEGQRLALARELVRKGKGKTLYVLDEPTTGLHLSDVDVLLAALEELVELGHTVVLIEHTPEVIAASDWVIDLGPGGGPLGGRKVAEGTPREVASVEASFTGRALRGVVDAR